VRGQVLTLKGREFVEAAHALGAGPRDILLRHILPNSLGPVIVLVAFGIPRAVFVEATLSFIGFGVNPRTPSWGTMVQEGYSAMIPFLYLVLFPSIAIALLMLAFTFLGDGLRDALDPRMQPAEGKTPDAQTVVVTTGPATEATEEQRAA
jgi:oligopeptide transport system permease protein